jgi:hypothetical protein
MTEGETSMTNKKEGGRVGGANAPERLPDWMRRNHEAVQVPIRRDAPKPVKADGDRSGASRA